MLNVRRSDGRVLNWILDRQPPTEPGYCTDPECEGWATNPHTDGSIRWCDAFFEHGHVGIAPHPAPTPRRNPSTR